MKLNNVKQNNLKIAHILCFLVVKSFKIMAIINTLIKIILVKLVRNKETYMLKLLVMNT